MKTMPFHRYKPFQRVALDDRRWPNHSIDAAPIWCSVDLRDGNQALIEPMSIKKKCQMFNLLVHMGFKQIEVGFPSASQVEFDFIRTLIDENLIPHDVMIQVLTPARDEFIRRTFDAVHGAHRVIVHIYNPTSTLQRRIVFGLDQQGTIDLILPSAILIKQLASEQPNTEWIFEYSPESFTGTELDFACRICSEVISVWQPSPDHKAIINLPATVEMSTPNKYADMIEWMCRNLPQRDSLVISVHPHNDRGTGIAAAELGLMAGADRVEGTLFGNGERTGNVDIVTLALNLMTQGVDPELDISDIGEVIRVAENCTGIEVHPRHPYAGELAYTALSGGHQDAIKKGMNRQNIDQGFWEVPYLPIDPKDIGRSYQSIVRINSQSGKGGVAYIMEHHHGFQLPRGLQIDFGSVVQKEAEQTGCEVLVADVFNLFRTEYLQVHQPIVLIDHHYDDGEIITTLLIDDTVKVRGKGNGPVDAFMNVLCEFLNLNLSITSYSEHAIPDGDSSAEAVAYVAVRALRHDPVWGVGVATDITKAALLAIICAVNRSSFVSS